MAESYSVKAVLCAEDKNFSSMMKSCSSYADNLKNTLTSGIGFGANGGVYGSTINSSANRMTWKGTPATGATRLNKTSTAGSSTQSIVQPYITCYMWKRTA